MILLVNMNNSISKNTSIYKNVIRPFNLIYLLQQVNNIFDSINTIVAMQPKMYRSSFNTVHHQDTSSHLIQEECKRVLKNNQKIEVAQFQTNFASFPYMLRLILTLYYTLSKKLASIESSAYQGSYFINPISTHLKYSLLKLLAKIIEKNLFLCPQPTQVYQQLSFSLIIKQCLFSFILSVISENKNLVAVEKLITFYKNLTSEEYMIFIPIHVYHLFGGGVFTIEARTFREKLTAVIESLGKVLSSSQNIINRNIQFWKGSRQRQPLLEQSVNVVIFSKNKQSRVSIINGISNSIFMGKEYLSKEEFISKLEEKSIEPILTIFLKLIQAETLLFQEKAFKLSLQRTQQSGSTNFYSNQMSKMFNKCPFNGDDKCDCKKCQCVRRNRESAKLSQDRKRSAIGQIATFQKKVEELEQRNQIHQLQISSLQQAIEKQTQKSISLHQQNLMLRSLLKEMNGNPSMKLLIMQQIPSMSQLVSSSFTQ